ncbi:hypothetical protein YPPY64_1477, partial [Yersinia pestis PY-64]
MTPVSRACRRATCSGSPP